MTEPDVPPSVRRISAVLPGWRTARTSLRVLLVIHSATAAARLGDLVPLLSDPRMQVFCVRTSDAMFPGGVEVFVRGLSIHELDWRQATELEFDVAITASLGDNLHEIRCPILRIPHGNGYNKRWVGGRRSAVGGRRSAVFGLSGETLEHQGVLVPAAIGVSHDEQFQRLAEGCPEAVPAAFLAGDPCYDRMLASLPRRLNYRRDLGLRDGQRLVTIASTWRDDSLFGVDPMLASRLLAELPHDRYRVALILHPNIWASHSGFQIRAWLAAALRAGLILVPPDEGWRAAVIAADWVLSDHGSVSVYAAAAGRPVLLEQSGRGGVDPRSGLGRLFAVAAPLRPRAALEPQLRRAEELLDRTRATATAWVSSAPGRSLRLIRDRLYALMDAAPPGTEPPVLAVDPPAVPAAAPLSLWTDVRQTGPGELTVERRPAVLAETAPSGVLIVSDGELDHRLAAAADVIWTTADALPTDEAAWSAAVFGHRPGLTLTMVQHPRHALLRSRDGRRTVVTLALSLDRSLDHALDHPLDHRDDHAGAVFAVLAERHVSGIRELGSLSPVTLRFGPAQTVQATFSATSS